MEIKNIHQHAGWFASYMNAPDGGNDQQGQALVQCQMKKIEQLNKLIETIEGEIQLHDEPKEYDAEIILESIRSLIEQKTDIEVSVGYYKWIG